MRFPAVLILCGCFAASCGPDPVTSGLAIGGAGLVTGKVLDKMSDKVSAAIGQAASAGSLTADAAARNLLLQLQAAKASLAGDLDKQWDRMDSQKVSLLRVLDTSVLKLDETKADARTLEQMATLDISDILDKMPFINKNYAITRIEGATQWFRARGS